MNGRAQTCLRELRKLAQDRIDPVTGEVLVSASEGVAKLSRPYLFCELNTFPTGAGLASSVAGLAGLSRHHPGEIVLLQGRVSWSKKEDATDSIAIQVADEHVSSLVLSYHACFDD